MITYINRDNASQYQALFEKAAEILKEKKPSTISEVMTQLNSNWTWDSFTISSLNEYFAYLKDITEAINDTDINKKRFFLRLPLDEEVFEIDANTRKINIPASFSRSGVGVQGDEIAETIYFTIDRYFDHTDLANDNIQIAFQWEIKDGNTIIPGISRNFGKDIETIPGKIIFGWPISKELTEKGGTVQFSVRFYSIDIENNQFIYSFTTLPAQITINNSLNLDLINNSVQMVDKGEKIVSRIKRSTGINDGSLPTPSAPIITTELSEYKNNNFTNNKIIDLPLDDSGVQLAIEAKPSDLGVIVYDWKRQPYSSQNGFVNDLGTGSSVRDLFIEETNSINVNSETLSQYYKKINENSYELLPNLDNFKKENNMCLYEEDLGFLTNNNNDITYEKLYKKINVATVKTAGKYTVDVTASLLINNRSTSSNNIITIPGPKTPIVNFDEDHNNSLDNQAHYIVSSPREDVIELVAIGQIGEFGLSENEVGNSPNVTLSYEWQKKDGENFVSINNNNNDDSPHYTITSIENGSKLSISNFRLNDDNNLEELYRVKVIATRNKENVYTLSNLYRITKAPTEPVLKYRVYNKTTQRFELVEKDYDCEENIVDITARPGVNTTLSFSVEPIDQSDKISYLWMKVKIDDPEDWIDGTNIAKLQVDLDDLIPELLEKFGNPRGNRDDFVEGQTYEQAKQFIADNFSEIDMNYNEPGWQDNGPRCILPASSDPTGIYYCVVINELNGAINANITPFFRVV